MGFTLEYREFQGTEKCPQYLWKQVLYSESEQQLEEIKSQQRFPEDWRIEPNATEIMKRRNAEELAKKTNQYVIYNIATSAKI